MKFTLSVILGFVLSCSAITSLLAGNDGVRGRNKGAIEAGASIYVAKSHKAWQKKGRLVGVAKKSPEFTIKILNAKGRTIREVEAEMGKDGARAYEVWLKAGSYTMLVEAKGYTALDVKHLVVKKGHDLRTDLEFTPAGKK